MTTVRTARLMVAIALAVGTLAACSGDDDAGRAGPPPDHACDMLTTREASALLGVPAHEPAEDTDRSGGSFCRWSSMDSGYDPDASDEDDRPQYYVAVEAERGPDRVQSFELTKVVDADRREVVEGLGDDAHFLYQGLTVRHGDRVVTTYAGGNRRHPLSPAQERRIERQAAELVVEKLGDSRGGEVAAVAAECALTRRCYGTRYRACELVDDADITRITGAEVVEVDGLSARPAGSDASALCDYTLGRDERRALEFRVEPEPQAARRERDRLLDQASDEVDGLAARPVPDLGDEAFYIDDFHQLSVLEDGALLQVTYEAQGADSGDESTDVEEVALALARIALDRM
jgi:hypothetical protein